MRKNKRKTPALANIICVLIDRSASTIDMAGAPIFEMIEQLKILKKDSKHSNVDIRFNLASFNDSIEYIIINKQLKNIEIPSKEKLIKNFEPKGRSRLYNAIYKCIDLLEKQREKYIENLPSPVSKLDPEIVISLIVLTDNIDIYRDKQTKQEIKKKIKKSRYGNLRFKIIIANSYVKNIKNDLDLHERDIIQVDCNYNSIRGTLKNLYSTIKNIDDNFRYI